ncbi:MAG: hemolysin family protein [Candidatus Omnitrophica bacterium]|nr:hemolysin family protein [Candidatus Omnitrophota bacterium]MDD5487979.1 hemolysin family protein [Candidatus Omnitrophota bacterium]
MIPLYTILVVAAIFFHAFFTASEMAFTSVNRVRLRSLVDAGSRPAIRLHDFLKDEGAYLGTTLVGTNISVVISSVLATRIFMEYFPQETVSVLVTLIMVPLTLMFAEIIPKILARQFATTMALRLVYPIGSFNKIFRPVISVVNFIARRIISPIRGGQARTRPTVTKSDLKKLLYLGHEMGTVEAGEVELIHKVLDFGTKKAGSIMVPLYRLSSISAEDPVSDLKKLVALTGFSRIPVYRERKNNIVGIINIYDILYTNGAGVDDMPVQKFMRELVYLDKDDGLDIALARLRHRKQPMGIVADQMSQIVGIVTIEDILEELVGELEDTR